MKLIFSLFCVVFLPACTVYTVTNKTDRDFEIKKAGEELIPLKAGKCIELTEYFLGLAGDFPFVIEGEEKERNPGHYEITYENPEDKESVKSPVATPVVSTVPKPYTVALSEKNPECNEEEEEEEDGDAEEGEDETTKDGETKLWLKDTSKNVFCLSGQPRCSEGTVACLLENQESQPACVREQKAGSSATDKERKWEKVAQAVLSCEGGKAADQNKKALCLPPVSVNVVTNPIPLCGGGQVECANGGRAVCGKAPGDLQNKAYCVNTGNIRFGEVTCANGIVPSCSGQST